VTVWSALAAVLTGPSRTAATEPFNGISVRIVAERSTIGRSLTVYTHGFRAYDALEDDVFKGDDEMFRAFQLRRELLHKPTKEALKHAIKATL